MGNSSKLTMREILADVATRLVFYVVAYAIGTGILYAITGRVSQGVIYFGAVIAIALAASDFAEALRENRRPK